MLRTLALSVSTLGLLVATSVCWETTEADQGFAGCPPSARLLAHFDALPLDAAARSARFAEPVPEELYRRAASAVGRPALDSRGGSGAGVLIVERPLVPIWRAVNDEERHDDGYLPVAHSEVIAGVPRGRYRRLFQYFSKWGFGRWWVTRVEMSGELFSASDGRLWETWWQDDLEAIDPAAAPMNRVSDDMQPLRRMQGSWLLVDLGPRCTAIEQYYRTELGGFLGVAQSLASSRSQRATLDGLLRLADALSNAVDEAPFLRPDGTQLPAPWAPEQPPALPPG